MAFTLADVANLDAQYKMGARVFRHGERTMELYSADDYIKIRNMMLNEAQGSALQPIRQVRVATTNGWGH
jgi:hypothetical protein